MSLIQAKCIGVRGKHYRLKDNTLKEIEVTYEQLKSAVDNKKISIINLKPNYDNGKFELDPEMGLANYKMLKTDKESEKAKIVYEKSKLLGVCPDTSPDEKIIAGNKVAYDNLYITDCTRVISEYVNVNNTITFVGTLPLRHALNCKDNLIVRCDKAVILNPCVMSNLKDYGFFDKSYKIIIKTHKLEIKHEFIDENTIFELWYILYNSKFEYSIQEALHIVKIHFNKQIDIQKIKANVRKISSVAKSLKSRYINSIDVATKNGDGSDTYITIKRYSVYHLLILSLMVSLPHMKDFLEPFLKEALDGVFELIRAYNWDYVKVPQDLRECRSISDELISLEKKYKNYGEHDDL